MGQSLIVNFNKIFTLRKLNADHLKLYEPEKFIYEEMENISQNLAIQGNHRRNGPVVMAIDCGVVSHSNPVCVTELSSVEISIGGFLEMADDENA